MVTLSSETLFLLEATEVINEISVNIQSQLLISKITTSFDDNFDPPSMNIRIEVEKYEPETRFENTINEIKDNHLKIIASTTMNISAIILFEDNFKQLSMNSSIELVKVEPGPTFEKTINEIKANYLKSIACANMNISAIILFDKNFNRLV